MRIKLISMPWQNFDSPSLAMGNLVAFIKAQESRVIVEGQNEHVSVWARIQDIYEVISSLGDPSELVYLQLLYPENSSVATQEILAAIKRQSQQDFSQRLRNVMEKDLTQVLAAIRQHLMELAPLLARDTDLAVLTTSNSQLFSSLCLARSLKKQNPSLRIALEGEVVRMVGTSLLAEYPFIDFLIGGEGELRLLHLIRCLLDGKEPIAATTGILSQANRTQVSGLRETAQDGEAWEVVNLEELPPPDYDDYQARTCGEHNVLAFLPIEISRDRSRDRHTKPSTVFQADDLQAAAHRCDRSVPRIMEQLNQLSSRYQNTRFIFRNGQCWLSELRELAQAIRVSGKSYWFSMKLGAGTKASRLADLKEAACRCIEVGIKGLSTTYLKRQNKDMTTIQNLYVMRACCELEIALDGNLVLGFPGATQAEVEETCFNILNYAISFTPLNVSYFALTPDSTVFLHPTHFGVKNIRMAKAFQNSLPRDVASRLQLPWLEFDMDGKQADWRPVREACQKWWNLYQKIREDPAVPGIPKSLFYFDGGDFLKLIDARQEFKTITWEALWRDIYLYCMEIHSRQEIVAHFQGRTTEELLVHEILDPMVTERLMFMENSQYLSLAIAYNASEAIRRIRSEETLSTPARDK